MTSYTFRLDPELKEQAFSVFRSYGLNPAQALKMILQQVVSTKTIPVQLDYQPNETTIRAMQDALNGKVESVEAENVEELIKKMKISFTKDYKRDLKRLANQPEILLSAEMIDVMHHLLNGKNLPEKYKDHALSGNWKGFRDCHIKNDLVLIYHVNNEGLTLVRLNTHSEVFR